jgi:hypothetical protein
MTTDPEKIAAKPWCETCGKPVYEILCPVCAKWWEDNKPVAKPDQVEAVALDAACEACANIVVFPGFWDKLSEPARQFWREGMQAAIAAMQPVVAEEMVAEGAMAMCEEALGGKRCPCREAGSFNCADEHPGRQSRACLEAALGVRS